MSLDMKLPSPDKFFGQPDEDIERWLFRFQQYCEALSIPEQSYTPLAATLLDGSACDWWRNRIEEVEPTQKASAIPWDQFKSEITRQFSISQSVVSARCKLFTLSQHSTVEEYAREYLQMLVRTKPKPIVDDQICFFIAGLKQPLCNIVGMKNPKLLEDAIELAKAHEQAYDAYSMMYSAANQHPRSNVQNTPRLAPLTDQERDDLRRQGGCFRCRQPGHNARQCPLGLNGSGNVQTQQ